MADDIKKPVIRTEFEGRVLDLDFSALKIGCAQYDEAKTGCTVFRFDPAAMVAADVRGGSVGTTMEGDGWCDAICYAGGSLMGLEASAGVAAEIFQQNGRKADFYSIPLVKGAIIYDFGSRTSTNYPDIALGRAALRAARTASFPMGPKAAGRSATVGNGFQFDTGEASGQGAAFRQIGDVKIAVFTVVNAIGGIMDRSGKVVRGQLDRTTGERRTISEDVEYRLKADLPLGPQLGNTTLTLVVTNMKIGGGDLTQFSRQVHASMARAIQPFHSRDDGDVLYAATTSEVEASLPLTAFGVIASELAWDAVLNCWQE